MSKCDYMVIGDLFNQQFTTVEYKPELREEHREIYYNGVSIHGILKDGVIVTCYEKELFPSIEADAYSRMHNQLEEFRLENERLKEKTMRIVEVAETLKVNEITVRRAIKELFPDLIKNGVTTLLNEGHVTAIKLRLEKNHPDKNVEVIRTDLEETLLVKQGYEILMGRQAKLEQENSLLQNEVKELTPKAEFYDQVTDSTNAIDIGTVANVLNIKDMGRNKLFAFLRARGVLKENNQPYRQFIDRGYFRIIEQKYDKPDGSTNVSFKTVVYQSGVDYIRKLIEKENINE